MQMVRLSNNNLMNCHTYRNENDVSRRTDDGSSNYNVRDAADVEAACTYTIIDAKRNIWYVPETKQRLEFQSRWLGFQTTS